MSDENASKRPPNEPINFVLVFSSVVALTTMCLILNGILAHIWVQPSASQATFIGLLGDLAKGGFFAILALIAVDRFIPRG